MGHNFKDNFAPVHDLIRGGLLTQALDQLLNIDSGRVRKDFVWDKNHAWYCIGDIKYRLGDMQGAIVGFKKAFKASPQDISCLLAIGNCYDALKKPRMAEKILRQALALNPTGRQKAAISVNLGNALFDQGRWLDAMECFMLPSRRRDDVGVIARKNLALAKERLKSASIK